MSKRQGNGIAPFVPLLSAATDAAGVATFTVPAGTLRRYDGCLPVVVAATTGAGTGRYTAQVTAEPAVGSRPAAAAVLTITVAVSQSNTITTLLLGQGMGLVNAGAGITVRLMLAGV